VLLVASAYVLHRRRRSDVSISRAIAMAGPIMFALASAHLGTDLARVILAFIQAPDSETQLAVLNSTTSAVYVFKTSLFMAQTVWVGDGFLVYRLNMVWNGDKRVMVPICIALMGSMATSIAALHADATSIVSNVFVLRKWAFAAFSMTLGVNFSGTTLIAARIIWNERHFRSITVRGRNVLSAAVIIIESGAIYSMNTILLLIFFGAGNYVQYVFLDALVQIVGIVFSMIIVRIGLGMSSQTTYRGATTRRSTGGSSGLGASLSQSLSVPAPAMAINVSKVTQTNSDRSYIKDHGLAPSTSEDVLELSPSKRHVEV